jgi:acyl carrier protein
MDNLTKDTVLDFMLRNGRQPLPGNEADALACAYLDSGIIDSLGIISMVSEFESKFAIRFSAEDMQSYEFQTIGGLITLVNRLRSTKQ